MKRIFKIVIPALMLLVSACIAPLPEPPLAQSADPGAVQKQTITLTDQVGRVTFPISCATEAQEEFNRGVAFLHSFWFPPALESFSKVSELDTTCGMAYWGIAMSRLGIPWTSTPAAALESGHAAVEQAQERGGKTEREQAYIDAIAAFYQDSDTLNHHSRAEAYTAAMEQLAQDYPEDMEAQIFYALALNITASPEDKEYVNQTQAVAILEPIFQEHPNHPGVTHYLIHSNDYPALAANGLHAAQRYAEIAPAAPHALHMPAHIFTRLGHWQESVDTNKAAADTAIADLAPSYPPYTGFEPALHAMDYMMYGYLQMAHDTAAGNVLARVSALHRLHAEGFGAVYALAAIPSRYVLERGAWSEGTTLHLRPSAVAWERFPQAEAVLIFARGMSAARGGELDAAEEEVARLTALRQQMSEAGQAYWANQAEIQIEEIRAWIALRKGDDGRALESMRTAVELEAATEKHPVTPGPLVPAAELLGEMLLELGDPHAALAAFERSQETDPGRLRGLYGAARAAEQAGELQKARRYYEALVTQCEAGNKDREELVVAKTFLADARHNPAVNP